MNWLLMIMALRITQVACAGGGLSLIQPVLDRIGKENVRSTFL